MKAGDLRHIVEIVRTATVINPNGYPVSTRTTVCRVAAAIRDEKDRQVFAGDAQQAENVTTITIRYRTDVARGMTVRFRGADYEIRDIDQYLYRDRYLALKCTAKEGGGV